MRAVRPALNIPPPVDVNLGFDVRESRIPGERDLGMQVDRRFRPEVGADQISELDSRSIPIYRQATDGLKEGLQGTQGKGLMRLTPHNKPGRF